MKRHTVLPLAIFFFMTAAVLAQSDPTVPAAPPEASTLAFGISAGGTLMMHSGPLQFPRETPPLIQYDDASGLGPALGLRANIAVTPNIGLSPRLFAEYRCGSFTSDPFTMEIIGRDLQPQDMVLEDELDVTLLIGGVDVLVTWAPTGGGWYFAAGPSVGIRLSEDFLVTESIRSPEGVTFLNGMDSQEMYDGDPGLTRSLHLGLRGGAGFQVALNRDLALGVELLYLYSLQSVTEDDDWTAQGLQGSIALLFLL